MNQIRQFLGYSIGVAILIAALKFSLQAIALEAADYVPAPIDRAASPQRAESSSMVATREASAPPVWIAPTPKYQYDPKLMELKPPRQLQKEAELRRQQQQAQAQVKQRDAKVRRNDVSELARKALASAGEPASPPAYLMFSPH